MRSWQAAGIAFFVGIFAIWLGAEFYRAYRKASHWRLLRKRAWDRMAEDPRASIARFNRIHTRG